MPSAHLHCGEAFFRGATLQVCATFWGTTLFGGGLLNTLPRPNFVVGSFFRSEGFGLAGFGFRVGFPGFHPAGFCFAGFAFAGVGFAGFNFAGVGFAGLAFGDGEPFWGVRRSSTL